LSSHIRVLEINVQLNDAIKELRLYNQKLYEEQKLVEHIFSHALNQSCLDSEFISYKNRPCEQFDGDVILAERGPSGNLYILVGDFTGHGLHAAVGALPVCQIFFTMARKGVDVREIIVDINNNLKMLFPPNMFMCASIAEVDPGTRKIKLWSGGMPLVLLMNKKTGEKSVIPSQHMPLGILDSDEFDDAVKEIEFVDDSYLYMCSDGIIETRNSDNNEYGIERLLSNLGGHNADIMEVVFNDVDEFRGGLKQEDDMTLVEVGLAKITSC
ncbi:MAG: serine/threonine-protein phosphatase, partial [Gammaproteobacteria bacterium]|nr:serine/threonine-protein phosphatase [Gammaproteobacteria bacterium]